jgi:hypothetical protein
MTRQAPDFEAAKFLEPLKQLHRSIVKNGPLTVLAHHFLIEGRKTS